LNTPNSFVSGDFAKFCKENYFLRKLPDSYGNFLSFYKKERENGDSFSVAVVHSDSYINDFTWECIIKLLPTFVAIGLFSTVIMMLPSNSFSEYSIGRERANNLEEKTDAEQSSNIIQETAIDILKGNKVFIFFEKTENSAKPQVISYDPITFDEQRTLVMKEIELKNIELSKVQELYSWVNPLPNGRFSSPFGNRSAFEDIPAEFHNGVDMAQDLGSPIFAAHDGTVVAAGVGVSGWEAGIVVLRHETPLGTQYTLYYHMNQDGILVKEGDEVKAGDTIALVGNEGRSTGPHLHLCVLIPLNTDDDWTDSEFVDPVEFFSERNINLIN